MQMQLDCFVLQHAVQEEESEKEEVRALVAIEGAGDRGTSRRSREGACVVH